MSKEKIRYIHLFIWLFAIFANLPYSIIGHAMPPEQIVSNVIAFLYLMLVFYLFYLFLVPYFLEKGKIYGFFFFSFIIVLVMPFFGYTILFFFRALFDGSFEHFYNGYSLKMHMSGYYPVMTAAVFGSFFRVILNWFTTLNQKAELDREKLAVELDLLKSKLNPHFLFNTLNNIDSLIISNPEAASSALIRLSEIMRYLTYETTSDFVPLEKEAVYIRNFIELHRIRVKSPDDIRFEVDGDLSVLIAPAIFLPVIENSFKYASFRIGTPCVDIKLISENGIVKFSISNYFEKSAGSVDNSHSGYGIGNLKKRLELTYPGKYQFMIEPSDQVFTVKLTIDTNANQLYSN
jgi:two-component system, LytTR family, sensor kinase